MKNFLQLGIITLMAVISFSIAACDDGSGDGAVMAGGTGINVPGVDQLPAFPAGSTPAATKADAETILAELRQSRVLDSLNGEMWAVVEEYDDGFSNKFLPDGNVKVSYKRTEDEIYTDGFKALNDFQNNDEYDQEELSNLQFTLNDKESWTVTEWSKGEVTKAKTQEGVTIAPGSMFEEQANGEYLRTVSTAGAYKTCRVNATMSEKSQIVSAFTVTTSSGSVKVILDATHAED